MTLMNPSASDPAAHGKTMLIIRRSKTTAISAEIAFVATVRGLERRVDLMSAWFPDDRSRLDDCFDYT
jgi:hypothetical protein